MATTKTDRHSVWRRRRRRRRASAASERRGETAVTHQPRQPTNQRHARGPISAVAIATANSIDDDRQQATHTNTEKELRDSQSEPASQFLSTSYSVCVLRCEANILTAHSQPQLNIIVCRVTSPICRSYTEAKGLLSFFFFLPQKPRA